MIQLKSAEKKHLERKEVLKDRATEQNICGEENIIITVIVIINIIMRTTTNNHLYGPLIVRDNLGQPVSYSGQIQPGLSPGSWQPTRTSSNYTHQI